MKAAKNTDLVAIPAELFHLSRDTEDADTLARRARQCHVAPDLFGVSAARVACDVWAPARLDSPRDLIINTEGHINRGVFLAAEKGSFARELDRLRGWDAAARWPAGTGYPLAAVLSRLVTWHRGNAWCGWASAHIRAKAGRWSVVVMTDVAAARRDLPPAYTKEARESPEAAVLLFEANLGVEGEAVVRIICPKMSQTLHPLAKAPPPGMRRLARPPMSAEDLALRDRLERWAVEESKRARAAEEQRLAEAERRRREEEERRRLQEEAARLAAEQAAWFAEQQRLAALTPAPRHAPAPAPRVHYQPPEVEETGEGDEDDDDFTDDEDGDDY